MEQHLELCWSLEMISRQITLPTVIWREFLPDLCFWVYRPCSLGVMSTSCWYHTHWAILTEVGCVFISQRAPTASQSCVSLLRSGPHLSLRKSLSHFSCLTGGTLEPKYTAGIHFTHRKSKLFFFLLFFLQGHNRSQEDKTNSSPYVIYSCCLHFLYFDWHI